jgi:type IV secretion system protein VirB2
MRISPLAFPCKDNRYASGRAWSAVVRWARQKNLRWEREMSQTLNSSVRIGLSLIAFSLIVAAPDLALAQSTSPFLTGASALQTNILAWLTPIAIILVMVLGAMAMANRISWGWCIAAILGIAISFGAPQIVTWVRGMFGV